ncbi:MAG TPA: MATE family efflux transporter [Lachnospiraceae bacterium]|nr:MATE family efflux transporter [Lachnospiraceae bacterium]
MNMLSGSLWNKLIFFAFPLAATNILQQLFNSVDTAVAGRFAGDNALAAVGANASIISVFVNLFSGLAIGTNVVIATFVGQKRKKDIPKVVHTSIALALLFGFAISFLGLFIARPVLAVMGTPKGEVLDLAVVYLRIYFVGMPAILVYNYGAAVLRSIGDTKRPMFALILSGIVNVILNLLLVICFDMSVVGVAIATVISNIISASIVVITLIKNDSEIHLDLRKLSINKKYLKKIMAIGAPAGIQGAVFSLSNVLIQTGINSFMEDAMSGSSIALTFECFSFYIATSFSQAAVTFVSQNYGAGQLKRCRRITRIAMIEGFLFTEIASCIFFLTRYQLIHLFTLKSGIVYYAIWRMTIVMMLEGMTGLYEILGATIRGTGHSTLPALITTFGTVGFRVFWLYTVFKYHHSFKVLMAVYPCSWLFIMIMMTTAYVIIIRKVFREHAEIIT